MSIVIRGKFQKAAPATVLGYVTGAGGAAISQATVTSISRAVYDLSGATPDEAAATAEVVVADAVYDTPQTDAMWEVDGRGYNFRDDVPAAVFAAADHVYRVEYTVTPAEGYGDPFTLVAVGPAEEVLS